MFRTRNWRKAKCSCLVCGIHPSALILQPLRDVQLPLRHCSCGFTLELRWRYVPKDICLVLWKPQHFAITCQFNNSSPFLQLINSQHVLHKAAVCITSLCKARLLNVRFPWVTELHWQELKINRNTALPVKRTKSNPRLNYGLFKNNNNELPIVIYSRNTNKLSRHLDLKHLISLESIKWLVAVKAGKWKYKMSAAGKETKFLLLCNCSISHTTIPGSRWCVQAGPESPFHLGISDKIICLNAERLEELMRKSKEDILNQQKKKERKKKCQYRTKMKA